MKHIALALAVSAATPALADDFYVGVSGNYGVPVDISEDSTEPYEFGQSGAGIFIGKSFDYDGFFLMTEAAVRVGFEDTQIWTWDDFPYYGHGNGYLKERFSTLAHVGIGHRFDGFSVFAKGGVGFSLLKEMSIITGSGGNRATEQETTTPVFSAAIGTQYDIDKYFVRIEGEYRWLPNPDYYEMNLLNVTGSIGVRF